MSSDTSKSSVPNERGLREVGTNEIVGFEKGARCAFLSRDEGYSGSNERGWEVGRDGGNGEGKSGKNGRG